MWHNRTILRCLPSVLVGGILSAAVPASSAPPEVSASPARIEVDLSERTLSVYHGGELRTVYAVAVGQPEHPTPTGEFTIDRIIWNPGWVPPDVGWAKDETAKEPGEPDNPMQGAKLFFKYPDYYIHGTNAPETVGSAASHGCIRMRPEDVERLAKFVQEHGGESRSAGWYREVKRDDENKHEIFPPDPVPISIRE